MANSSNKKKWGKKRVRFRPFSPPFTPYRCDIENVTSEMSRNIFSFFILFLELFSSPLICIVARTKFGLEIAAIFSIFGSNCIRELFGRKVAYDIAFVMCKSSTVDCSPSASHDRCLLWRFWFPCEFGNSRFWECCWFKLWFRGTVPPPSGRCAPPFDVWLLREVSRVSRDSIRYRLRSASSRLWAINSRLSVILRVSKRSWSSFSIRVLSYFGIENKLF